jgi:hypothetical protein
VVLHPLRSCNLAELTDDVIDVLVDHGLKIASPATVFSIYHLGGAVARVDEDETAFGGRDAGYTVNVIGITTTGEGFELVHDGDAYVDADTEQDVAPMTQHLI